MSAPLAMQVKDLTTALNVLKEEKAAFEADLVTAKSEKEDIESRLAKLEEEKKEIEAKLEEMEKDKEEAAAKVTAESEAKAAAEADLKAAQSEVEKLKAMLESGKTPKGEGEGVPTGSGDEPNTISRAEYAKLHPLAQNAFYRNGGKVTE